MTKRMSAAAFVIAALGIVAGCSDKDVTDSRETVLEKLRDPKSAEFRDEHVRVLWSDAGSRLKIYCADVNSNNAFGGKTGFLPVERVISYTKNGRPVANWFEVGETYVHSGPNATHELRCHRKDTQREDSSIMLSIAAFGGNSPEAIRRELEAVPVISYDLAPELR